VGTRVVGLPAVLLSALLLSAAGRRAASARHRGRAAAVLLVLLPKRQGLLSDRSHMPGGVDQGPAASRCGPIAIIKGREHPGDPSTRALGEPDRGDDCGLRGHRRKPTIDYDDHHSDERLGATLHCRVG